MADFSLQSRIRDVLASRPDGAELLLQHGYRLGEGFVDVLSQYQTLEDAVREGRLRESSSLLAALNTSQR